MAGYLNIVSQAGGLTGEALNKATLSFFEAGPTTTKLDTYQDEALTIVNANPVVADGEGRFPDIWLKSQKYYIEFRRNTEIVPGEGTLIASEDNVIGQQVVVGAATLTNIAALTLLFKSTLTSGDVFEVDGHTTAGDGGGGRFFWDSTDTTTVDDCVVFASDEGGNGRWTRDLQGAKLTAAMAGMFPANADNKTALDLYLLSSTHPEMVFRSGQTYKYTSPVTVKNDKKLTADGSKRAIFDFATVFASNNILMTGTTLDRFEMHKIKILGDLTAFTNDGQPKYGFHSTASTNCHIDDCEAEGCENGIFFRDGSSDCSLTNSKAFNCYEHGLGSFGTSALPNVRMNISHNIAYSDETTEAAAPFDGIYVEETYDSKVNFNVAWNNGEGVRVENSCDNEVIGNNAYENWKVGIDIYIFSQRNKVHGNTARDNNRGNHDKVNATTSGNENTKLSGISVENEADCNSFIGNISYQTIATTIPFTSGSDEPTLGSLLTGATSTETARVRKIVLTSGTWAGNDAVGTFHVVSASAAFNASEVIKNTTTYVPYNSGSVQPIPGNVITQPSSGAVGTLLWASETGAGDWSSANDSGVLYLTGVTGAFDGAGTLDNTTTSVTNFATNNAAQTAEDTDIATTNGATVIPTNPSLGFQKYGIGVNIRNLVGRASGESYNTITGNSCFNNDLEQIEDRGYYNVVDNNNEHYSRIIRNAS